MNVWTKMPAFRQMGPSSKFQFSFKFPTSYYNCYATLEARIPLHSLMIGFISQCLQRATFKVDSKGVSRGDGSDASPTREVLKASRPQALVSGFFTLDHRFWPGYLSFSIQYLGTHCPPWISYIYDIDFYCPCKPERSDLIEVDEVRWGKVRYRPTQVLRIHIILWRFPSFSSLFFHAWWAFVRLPKKLYPKLWTFLYFYTNNNSSPRLNGLVDLTRCITVITRIVREDISFFWFTHFF